MLTKLRIGIEPNGTPLIESAPTFEHDRVLCCKRISLLLAHHPALRRRAPNVLQRVPAQAPSPSDVDDRGRIALAPAALVAPDGKCLGTPAPRQRLYPLTERLGDFV